MKRSRIVAAGCLAALMLSTASCNRGITDFHQKFDYAYIYFGDKLVVEGEVEKWWDYDNSDIVQVQIDGKVYLTHSANVLLVQK